jgi:hypothetical protein
MDATPKVKTIPVVMPLDLLDAAREALGFPPQVTTSEVIRHSLAKTAGVEAPVIKMGRRRKNAA